MDQAFVSSWLDYCHCLLFGIADGLMRRLEAVQNSVAHLIIGTSRRDHISPVLRQLHWLPFRHRILLKLAVLVFKALYDYIRRISGNLADDCQLVNYDHHTLLSAQFTAPGLVLAIDHSQSVVGMCRWPAIIVPTLISETINK